MSDLKNLGINLYLENLALYNHFKAFKYSTIMTNSA